MKRKMKNSAREKTKLMKERTYLVNAALDNGNCLTKSDIKDVTGLSLVQINNLFTYDRELYAKYVVIRKTLTDIASDNISKIVNDPKHPKNFDASKYILQNFKSDLDETLESSDSVFQIQTNGKSKSPINIVFGNTSEKSSK